MRVAPFAEHPGARAIQAPEARTRAVRHRPIRGPRRPNAYRVAGLALVGSAWCFAPGGAIAQDSGPPTIEEKTQGMAHLEGFFDLYWDEGEGKLYLEIDRWEEEFLHQVSLPTGLGSNPIGLDRGQLGSTAVLVARRVGPRVLLVEPNYRFRAVSENEAERRAVEEAFAPSTQWGFTVAARTGDRVLVDATSFFLRDAHGIARRLKAAGQGTYRLDDGRSAVYLPRTKAFPRNTEVEVSLTFTSDEPGGLVSQTAASGEAVTLREHHSFVELPEPYKPREQDPRIGAFGISFQDYARPIDEPITVRWAGRHRLEKKDPSAAMSEPVEPIVYYLDPGVPEPIRSALIEGGNWWNEAFEAAGFIDAFRVEMLPEDADPMDLRYNVIHWTHRSTRGWSYGSSVSDPRTGEILKGNVNLGSLRLRQDHRIGVGLGFPPAGARGAGGSGGGGPEGVPSSGYAGLAAAYGLDVGWGPGAAGGASPPVALDRCDLASGPTFDYLARLAARGDPTDMALARIRQLSAHEIGHTLGFAHNYIASTYGRGSVMDYPAPTVRVVDGEIDLTDAYAVGIGEYDKLAVRWLYSEFAPGVDEDSALDAIVEDGLARGLRFITDRDARPPGAAHPLAHLWDNGADPIARLEEDFEVRRLGLEAFGPRLLRAGQAVSELHELLVPLYLHHRYQLEAAVRSIGGVDFSYAVKGDGQTVLALVPGPRQRLALARVLSTLDPAFLALPPRILDALPPPATFAIGSERFAGYTDPLFDPIAVAAAAADYAIGLLLHPARTARVAEQTGRDSGTLALHELLDALVAATWGAPRPRDAYRAQIADAVRVVALERLLAAAGPESAPLVRPEVAAALDRLAGSLEGLASPTPLEIDAARRIRRWQARPWESEQRIVPPPLPPGSPIGDGGRIPPG